MRTAEDVHRFWFVDHNSDHWWGGGEAFDNELRAGFGDTHPLVARGEAFEWRRTPLGRLSEVIVLDQFSRQLHRGSPLAFASDPMALALAQELVAGGHDESLGEDERIFAYMPFMHSESPVVHEEAKRLFTALGNENILGYEMRHFELIERFGRYPKRNAALGRQSTPEELAYIAESEDSVF